MLIGPLGKLIHLSEARRERISSWDRSGGNDDRIHIGPGETKVIAEILGSGAITHIWMTLESTEKHYLRKVILRMFWDEEENPSVETPIGDFFGAGHCKTANFVSLPIQMSPENGRGFNCWFPMPFSRSARIVLENQNQTCEVRLYYYIDYELWPRPLPNIAYFHAQWRRTICQGKSEEEVARELLGITNPQQLSPQQLNDLFLFEGKNTTGANNYVILEAQGRGHYVGVILYIHNLRETPLWNWYGEGDDMIFVDGEEWPPRLHGTGTEDYFNMAWCPTQPYSALYHGLILPGGPNWSGKITLYRFHIEDPIYFQRSIRVTIEHGHDNHRWDDLASIAFWYQTEPHAPFPPLPHVLERLPLGD
ncbi:MAG: glycoside hydrolase family 172 protein [Candidatus Bipolaricaulaceae bacterium]